MLFRVTVELLHPFVKLYCFGHFAELSSITEKVVEGYKCPCLDDTVTDL